MIRKLMVASVLAILCTLSANAQGTQDTALAWEHDAHVWLLELREDLIDLNSAMMRLNEGDAVFPFVPPSALVSFREHEDEAVRLILSAREARDYVANQWRTTNAQSDWAQYKVVSTLLDALMSGNRLLIDVRSRESTRQTLELRIEVLELWSAMLDIWRHQR